MNTPTQNPSNGLSPFEFQSNPLRVIADEHGKPWFIATEVCAILGYASSSKAIQEHCKKTGVTTRYIPVLSNRYKLIDEENLFLLVANSGRLGDEVFEAWVRNEVLPSLCKAEPSQTPPTPNGLTPFEFQTHQVRVQTDENGDPWFIAMDVAAILDYSDAHKMCVRLDDDEKQNRQIGGFGPRGVTLISESGLYEAIFGSSKPEAKAFKKWVKSEVLPSIRKTGSYAAQTRQLQEPPPKEPSVTRLLVTMRDGQQPITETLSPNKHVLSLNDFTELARKTGFLVISKEELNRLFGSGHEM